jgi:hypothetical protein
VQLLAHLILQWTYAAFTIVQLKQDVLNSAISLEIVVIVIFFLCAVAWTFITFRLYTVFGL